MMNQVGSDTCGCSAVRRVRAHRISAGGLQTSHIASENGMQTSAPCIRKQDIRACQAGFVMYITSAAHLDLGAHGEAGEDVGGVRVGVQAQQPWDAGRAHQPPPARTAPDARHQPPDINCRVSNMAFDVSLLLAVRHCNSHLRYGRAPGFTPLKTLPSRLKEPAAPKRCSRN